MKTLTINEYDKELHHFDILRMAANLRKQDADELKACGYNASLAKALNDTIDAADISFIVKSTDGDPLCIFGISSMRTELGTPIWFLGSNSLIGYRREFLIYAKQVVEYWRKEFGNLYNFISVENKQSIRWLKWLGAEFAEPISYGVNGELFMRFTLKGGV